MNLLSIDTSTEYLSLAVTRDNDVVARVHKKLPMMHSSLLVPMVDKILKKAHVRLNDLDGFCVSTGPGSFTGLRIGVTTIKGLSYVSGKPIAKVPTLDVIADNARRHKGFICPILDARKGKVYACFYRSDGRKIKRISKYLLLPLTELMPRLQMYDNVVLLGDMADKIDYTGAVLFRGDWHPDAETVARFGLELFKKNKTVNSSELEPMYLYSRECDIKGK